MKHKVFAIEVLDLSQRAKTILQNENITFLSQIENLTISDLKRFRKCGSRTAKEIFDKVNSFQANSIGEIQLIKNRAFLEGYYTGIKDLMREIMN